MSAKAPGEHDVAPMVKLRAPWVLLAKSRKAPVAHVLDGRREPTSEGSRFARCGAAGRLLDVDGEPLVPACETCHERYA